MNNHDKGNEITLDMSVIFMYSRKNIPIISLDVAPAVLRMAISLRLLRVSRCDTD